MRILTIVDKKKMIVAEKPVPKVEPGRALIKVSYAGICGSDWHMVWGNGVRAGQNAVAGHEFSGVIVDPGDTHFKAGDRVTAIEYTPCGECEYCRGGKKHLCPERFSTGIGLTNDGAFAEYLTAREDMIYKLPDSIDDVQAAMIEPCAVSMHGASLAGVKEGSKVLITGGGAIGLFAAASAKALGASLVVLTEVNPIRLGQAREAAFIDHALSGTAEGLTDTLHELAGGLFDCAVECSGNQRAATMALESIKPGATLTMLAYGSGPQVDSFSFINDEKRIQGGVFFTQEDFERVIAMMADGRIDIRKYAEIITMDDAQDTLLGLDNGTKNAQKYVIKITSE